MEGKTPVEAYRPAICCGCWRQREGHSTRDGRPFWFAVNLEEALQHTIYQFHTGNRRKFINKVNCFSSVTSSLNAAGVYPAGPFGKKLKPPYVVRAKKIARQFSLQRSGHFWPTQADDLVER